MPGRGGKASLFVRLIYPRPQREFRGQVEKPHATLLNLVLEQRVVSGPTSQSEPIWSAKDPVKLLESWGGGEF